MVVRLTLCECKPAAGQLDTSAQLYSCRVKVGGDVVSTILVDCMWMPFYHLTELTRGTCVNVAEKLCYILFTFDLRLVWKRVTSNSSRRNFGVIPT